METTILIYHAGIYINKSAFRYPGFYYFHKIEPIHPGIGVAAVAGAGERRSIGIGGDCTMGGGDWLHISFVTVVRQLGVRGGPGRAGAG